MLMPVIFFMASDFEEDKEMNDVDTITLSYSFYKVRNIEKDSMKFK